MFDTIHVYYRNEVASDYVYRLGDMLGYVHLSDVDRLPPGQGRGDFVGVIEALKEIGYDGWLSMEIGFNRRDVEPDQVARDAFNFIKPLIAA
jgi:protein FrlC